MRREIVCEKCAPRVRLLPEDEANGFKMRTKAMLARKPPAYSIFENGKPIALANLLCDRCGVPIVDGTRCLAVTFWNVMREKTPRQWEPAFGDPIEGSVE